LKELAVDEKVRITAFCGINDKDPNEYALKYKAFLQKRIVQIRTFKAAIEKLSAILASASAPVSVPVSSQIHCEPA